MSSSFILKIQTFLEENNLPFLEIPIKLTSMPKSFKYAILAEVYDTEKHFKKRQGLEYFNICRNQDGLVYITAYDHNKNLGVNIYQTGILYEGRKKGLKINEKFFLNKASRIDYDLSRLEFMHQRIPASLLEEILPEQRESYLVGEYSYYICQYLKYLSELYKDNIKQKKKGRK